MFMQFLLNLKVNENIEKPNYVINIIYMVRLTIRFKYIKTIYLLWESNLVGRMTLYFKYLLWESNLGGRITLHSFHNA